MKTIKKTKTISEKNKVKQITKFARVVKVKQIEIENDKSKPRGKVIKGDHNYKLGQALGLRYR